MTEKLTETDDGRFYKYENDPQKWYKTEASVMREYDIVHLRLVTSFELIMYLRVLSCPEVGKLYITYVKGVYLNSYNYFDPLHFNIDAIKLMISRDESVFDPIIDIPFSFADTNVMNEIKRALNALFPSFNKMDIVIFDQTDFDEMKRRIVTRNLWNIKQIAPISLHHSIMSNILRFCEPEWTRFNYALQPPITMRIWIGIYIYDDNDNFIEI